MMVAVSGTPVCLLTSNGAGKAGRTMVAPWPLEADRVDSFERLISDTLFFWSIEIVYALH